MAMSLLGGVHDPRSEGEFQPWIQMDADCHDYLDRLRWAARGPPRRRRPAKPGPTPSQAGLPAHVSRHSG